MNDLFSVFSALPKEEQQPFLNRLLQNLQISGSLQSFQNPNAEGYGYGGRVGYAFPTDDGKFTVGATGQGFSGKTPSGEMSKKQTTGGDISYTFGPNTVSVLYDKFGQLPSSIPPSIGEPALEDFLRLIYRREF